MQRANANNALLAHYCSTHCKKRRFVDNTEKDKQTNTFIRNLEFIQSNDDGMMMKVSFKVYTMIIVHALSFNF